MIAVSYSFVFATIATLGAVVTVAESVSRRLARKDGQEIPESKRPQARWM